MIDHLIISVNWYGRAILQTAVGLQGAKNMSCADEQFNGQTLVEVETI